MKCYLCNRDLVSRDCVTDKETQGIIHREHIIPDALRGRLRSSSILCEECGSKFGKNEDTGFTNLFAYISNLLRENGLPTEHGTKNFHKLIGEFYPNPNNLNDYIPIILKKDGKVYAKDRTYRINESTKTITLYLCANRNDKLVEAERLRIKNENPNIDISTYSITIYDEISSEYLGWNFSKENPDFNKYFAKGLQKIATEYALDCGVPKEQLASVLMTDPNTGKSKLIEDVECVPFFPCSFFDCVYETYRHDWEKEFPSHTLLLFDQSVNNSRWLFCYIDLFSTFQFYVVLSKEYSGEPIKKTYYQRILKSRHYNKTRYIDDTWSNSDIDIEVRELGLNYDSLPKNRNDLIDSVNKAIKERNCIKEQPNIEFALYKDLKTHVSKIQQDLLLYLLKQETQYVDKQAFQKISLNEITNIQQEIEVQAAEEIYRIQQGIIDENKYMSSSMPVACMNTWSNNPNEVRTYTKRKMNTLLEKLRQLTKC